jgi:hypothetical protein
MEETIEALTNIEDFDIIEKTQELYDKIGDDLSIEKIISLKPDINIISNECKKFKMFDNAKDKYEEFIKSIDEIEDKNSRLIAAWNHMDDRMTNAPTSLHFRGAIILTLPILDYVLESF